MVGQPRWSVVPGLRRYPRSPGRSIEPLHPQGCSIKPPCPQGRSAGPPRPQGCSVEPPRPPGVGSGVCHRSRPFHTKHPVGKTHNFYTARSRWNRRPFEVLFAGHLQAFLITGSLRGASLPPGFCLPEPSGKGGSPLGGSCPPPESPSPNSAPGLAPGGWSQPQDATGASSPCRSILRPYFTAGGELWPVLLEQELQRKIVF